MYPPEKQQVIILIFVKSKIFKLNAIVNRSNIIEFRATIGIADGNVIIYVVVFFENRDNLG